MRQIVSKMCRLFIESLETAKFRTGNKIRSLAELRLFLKLGDTDKVHDLKNTKVDFLAMLRIRVHIISGSRIRIRTRIKVSSLIRIPILIKPELDPHKSRKQDPDPREEDPHPCAKAYSGVVKAHNGAILEPWRVLRPVLQIRIPVPLMRIRV